MAEIKFSEEALADLEAIYASDPEAAPAFRELFANMRQALQGVSSGQYLSFEEGMEALTGNRPERVDE